MTETASSPIALQFINSGPSVVPGRGQYEQVGRAHVARHNHRTRLSARRSARESASQTSLLPAVVDNTFAQAAEATVPNLQSSHTTLQDTSTTAAADSVPTHAPGPEVQGDDQRQLPARPQQRKRRRPRALQDGRRAISDTNLGDDRGLRHTSVFSLLSRSPSMFGADTGEYPRSRTPSSTPWVVDYSLHVMLPNRMGGDRKAVAAWLHAFLRDPLIFHASHWCAAIHRDLLGNSSRWTEEYGVLLHKQKAVHLLRISMESFRTDDVDWIIYAIVCLSRADLQLANEDSGKISAFQPHVPFAHWTNLYGRTRLGEAHRVAISQLVNTKGGLSHIKTPGLAARLALIDLTAASMGDERPRFARYWQHDLSNLSMFWSLTKPDPMLEGHGFALAAQGHMPDEALTLFKNLSVVDKLLSRHGSQWGQSDEVSALIQVRNKLHYDLLCMPSWDDLPVEEKLVTHSAIYDISRITCIIYSNAVLLGLPPHTGWHEQLTSRVRLLLSLFMLDSLIDEAWPLLVWSAMVAGMAAYRSPHRQFFEHYLRDQLSLRQELDWQFVRKHVKTFIWSDSACEHGAAVLWDRVSSGGV
ncbi:hypothetical protein LTR95_002751 [Oleoguttula sp. CCFEE 5521]